MLDERKTAILRAVVQEYIETAQPVGSTHIADAPGVRVDFYVKNYNAGSAENVPIEFLGFTEVDVPAGATVPARCENCWRPSDIENQMPGTQRPQTE